MFQKLFSNLQLAGASEEKPDEYWVERLSAMLLVEIARSDSSIDDIELSTIQQALEKSSHSIDAKELATIIDTAMQDVETTISLHAQIRQINEGFSREQKQLLIEQMWRVALADGDLDKYEEYMIRKLSGLLYVSHQEFIQAKLKVSQP